MTDRTTEGVSKVRKSPKRGVKRRAVAFCDVCGWTGASHCGPGMMVNAHAELRYHREQAKCE